jgi:hypothetical protein
LMGGIIKQNVLYALVLVYLIIIGDVVMVT